MIILNRNKCKRKIMHLVYDRLRQAHMFQPPFSFVKKFKLANYTYLRLGAISKKVTMLRANAFNRYKNGDNRTFFLSLQTKYKIMQAVIRSNLTRKDIKTIFLLIDLLKLISKYSIIKLSACKVNYSAAQFLSVGNFVTKSYFLLA